MLLHKHSCHLYDSRVHLKFFPRYVIQTFVIICCDAFVEIFCILPSSGFPEHMQFPEFRRRFDFLAAPEHRSGHGDVVDEQAAVQKLLSHLDIDKNSYRTGLSQVRR